MSFKKKVKDFIKKSDVEINSKALDKRVKSAMKHPKKILRNR